VLIDWILSFAKQYSQHIFQVHLTGYIKNSVKENWHKILEDDKRGIEYEIDLKAVTKALMSDM
jgi:hypothetical protein